MAVHKKKAVKKTKVANGTAKKTPFKPKPKKKTKNA